MIEKSICSPQLLNVFGVDAVGEATVVFGGLVMFPFVALVVAGLPKVAENFRETPPQPQSKMQLGRFLAVMAWNNCGWDSTGNCAAEVRPDRTPAPLEALWQSA